LGSWGVPAAGEIVVSGLAGWFGRASDIPRLADAAALVPLLHGRSGYNSRREGIAAAALHKSPENSVFCGFSTISFR
jgi:hypothetical protein